MREVGNITASRGSEARKTVSKQELAKRDQTIAELLAGNFEFIANHPMHLRQPFYNSKTGLVRLSEMRSGNPASNKVRFSKAYDVYGSEIQSATGIWVSKV